MKRERRYWKIEGYDGDKLIYERVIPSRWASEKCMTEILCRLSAKHLTENDILLASVNGHSPMQSSLFEPLISAPENGALRYSMSVGEGVHYIASAWLKSELEDAGVQFLERGEVSAGAGVALKADK